MLDSRKFIEIFCFIDHIQDSFDNITKCGEWRWGAWELNHRTRRMRDICRWGWWSRYHRRLCWKILKWLSHCCFPNCSPEFTPVTRSSNGTRWILDLQVTISASRDSIDTLGWYGHVLEKNFLHSSKGLHVCDSTTSFSLLVGIRTNFSFRRTAGIRPLLLHLSSSPRALMTVDGRHFKRKFLSKLVLLLFSRWGTVSFNKKSLILASLLENERCLFFCEFRLYCFPLFLRRCVNRRYWVTHSLSINHDARYE